MMGKGRKRAAYNAAEIALDGASKTEASSACYWWLLIQLLEYRREVPVKEVIVFQNGAAYYVCPRCGITMEREFMAYCDRCGQHIGWKGYKKAKVIYPGKLRKEHG